jgi:hypothetical protein
MLATLQASPIAHLTFPPVMVWAALVGVFTPLIGYVVNSSLWKNAPEPAKFAVQIVIAAVAGGITTAISTNVFGLNNATLEIVGTSILAALAAHHWGWVPSTIKAKLSKEA